MRWSSLVPIALVALSLANRGAQGRKAHAEGLGGAPDHPPDGTAHLNPGAASRQRSQQQQQPAPHGCE